MLENGGAVAIKGFNYQKAVITLVAINNYKKPNFHIFVETKDDFEVLFDNYHAFVQVKGTKNLSLSKILSRKKKKQAEELSILEKSISNGNSTDRFKIITWDFLASDLKGMEVEGNSKILTPLYKYKQAQKEAILAKIKIADKEISNKIDHSYIYISPFKNEFAPAIESLLGAMVKKDIEVSKRRGEIALNELFTLIDQKSEIIVNNENDFHLKVLANDSLESIFASVSQMDMFDRLLNELPFSMFKKEKIKLAKVKIPILYNSTKREVKEYMCSLDLLNVNEAEIIAIIVGEFKNAHIDELILIAISIECYCELSEES